MDSKINPAVTILIPSGAGAPGFAGILRCLQEIPEWRILVGDTNPQTYGKALADGFVLMPSSSNENDYLIAIKSVCKDEGVDVILPITTHELEVLSKHKISIEAENVKVIVSDFEALKVANNKGSLAIKTKELKLPVPAFEIVSNKSDFKAAVDRLFLENNKLCFKPVTGNGSRGFGIIIANHDQANADLKSKAGILPLTLEEWLPRLDDFFKVDLIVAKYLPGKEYSVDLLCDQGKVLFCIPRTRDKMIGGISVAGSFERNFGLIAFCIQLAQELNLDGPIGMQWRENENGEPAILEINPRLQGTTSVLALAGLNIPVQSVRLAMGLQPSQQLSEFQWGRYFVRFWDERLLD